MAFRFSERHIEEYFHHGVTVFRCILPATLVADLRRAADAGRELARKASGPQAQRLQPLGQYGDRMDLKPFNEYLQLHDLRDAIQRVLSPEHELVGLERMGIFYEPSDEPWCTKWHRDITAQTPGVDPAELRELYKDARFFNQINCALYTDVSTWYVPGSDGRPDVSEEVAATQRAPELNGKPSIERERLCLEYCLGMPGAVQLVLEPGDLALYRPNGWHIGNYAPYRKRATLHDGAWNEKIRAWYQRLWQRGAELQKAAQK